MTRQVFQPSPQEYVVFDHLSEELTNVMRLKIKEGNGGEGRETRERLEILFLQASPQETQITHAFEEFLDNNQISSYPLQWCSEQEEDENCL